MLSCNPKLGQGINWKARVNKKKTLDILHFTSVSYLCLYLLYKLSYINIYASYSVIIEREYAISFFFFSVVPFSLCFIE